MEEDDSGGWRLVEGGRMMSGSRHSDVVKFINLINFKINYLFY